MARRIRKNPQTKALVQVMKQLAIAKNSGFWKRIATELEKPARNKRVVNLAKLGKHTKENEIVIVPGKVLSGGTITHKIHVAAENFSLQAIHKLKQSGSTPLSLVELMQRYPDGKNIRIIG